ncbi:hypothetical protein ACLKA6_000915 [Drosophila palustris]
MKDTNADRAGTVSEYTCRFGSIPPATFAIFLSRRDEEPHWATGVSAQRTQLIRFLLEGVVQLPIGS